MSLRAEPGPRLALLSLGCDKNTVDSERLLASLVARGAVHTRDPSDADVVVVNTCGFIDAAKQESIEMLLEIGRLKREGRCRTLVAMGCLVERHRDELSPELPEVDVFVGLRDIDRLFPELEARGWLGGPREAHPGDRLPLSNRRHVRYLKVSEGCDHGCAFCAIPLWRGRHRSFPLEGVVAEAQQLEFQGAVEVNLVAQDLAHYGREGRNGADLTGLLRQLLAETTIPWFRLLYIYSAGIRDPLVDLIATEPRIVPYLDMPIQHASDSVLERMRRPERRGRLREKVRWLRSAIPDLTLRTTVLVGFPGETDEDFRSLLDFLEETAFDRLGAFAFSPQEGTRAAAMDEDVVPPGLAQDRLEELLEVQRAISAERLAREVGRRREVLVERLVPRPFGRTRGQADDVDGVTALVSATPLSPGALVEVDITGAADFDLEGRVVRELRRPPRSISEPYAPRRRALPVVSLGLESGWGR